MLRFDRSRSTTLIIGIAASVGEMTPAAVRASEVPARISLDGEWAFSIHGRGRKIVRVPSTFRPVGGATLERPFTAPKLADGERTLLRFDGIAMTGEIFVNDCSVGRFGPYTPFTIDITKQLRSGENRLRVELTDLD